MVKVTLVGQWKILVLTEHIENVRLACLHISKAPWWMLGEFLRAVREAKMYQICSLLS